MSYKHNPAYEGSVVESANFSREAQRGRYSLHCLDEGAEAGTGGEELRGDVVAPRLPLGSTWMYPVLRQCTKHKGICRVCEKGAIVHLWREVLSCENWSSPILVPWTNFSLQKWSSRPL